MTKKESKQHEIEQLIKSYKEIGEDIKEKIDVYCNEYNEKLKMDADCFCSCFDPLFSTDPKEAKKFESHFVISA